jgi:hypothetical protein
MSYYVPCVACRSPIYERGVRGDAGLYHPHCIGGPVFFQAPPLTGDMVREIVREELERAMRQEVK